MREVSSSIRVSGLRNGGESGDPTAVSHPIRRVTACDAAARLLVPACRLEALAGLIEVMGEERGVAAAGPWIEQGLARWRRVPRRRSRSCVR